MTLPSKFNHALDIVFRHGGFARSDDGFAEFGIFSRDKPVVAVAFAADRHDAIEVLLAYLRARDECCNLLFFLDFPIDELLDIWMIDIHDDHLCGAAVVPPDLIAPAARSPIFKKLMRPEDFAARKWFAIGADFRKFVPVPEPYLKRRASRTQRSMMPFSVTRSSSTD